ncbi:hypothetical protein [Nannocystis bainbridge]|uniref:Secreted protein n=1 Tax=Nannocystis bainbridge TaxID=2995303 RepID=A0ABT5E5S0_9BACT|nr:hypothetical protein [Nannocystis bainbridge]MDC0721199.1 hypothetical protein [Nannocystis bainbridge]
MPRTTAQHSPPRLPRPVSRFAVLVGALCLSACVEADEFEDLDELAEDELALAADAEEPAEEPAPAAPLVGPDDLQVSEDPSLYCIPKVWSTCGPYHTYDCCPPDASPSANCQWRSCQQHLQDENCVIHSTGYTENVGCGVG